MSKQKVLIVDDEPKNQRIILETLDDQFETQVAASGDEAWRLLETFAADLVLLDIMMPGMDGYELCQKIKAEPRLRLTKIILVSGKAMIDERLKGYAVGANDYLTKPFIPEELMAKTQVFLRLTAMERQLIELNQSLDEKVRERTQQLIEIQGKLVSSAKMAALGEMAAGVAHEINTPLGVISSLVDQIAELLGDAEIDRAMVTEMSQDAKQMVLRISAIIKGLLTFSRETDGDDLLAVEFKGILQDTLLLCEEKIKHSGVKLEVEPFPEGLIINCRPIQISQVLLNLISNSCDAIAMQTEKWIKISIANPNDEVVIRVMDSGPRIPPEVRSKLFQPFFTTKELGIGTGLGLSVSQGIAKSHAGSLTLNAESMNTCFELRLPATKAAARPA
jgi:C4-dicarboxylate-specific signal transduction histidine kinase